MEKILESKGTKKQDGIATSISDKIEFKEKLIRRDRGHWIVSKEKNKSKDNVIINIYTPNKSYSSS